MDNWSPKKIRYRGHQAVAQAQGLSFQDYADGVQNRTEAFPNGQRSPGNARQAVQLVHRTPDDWAQEDLLCFVGSSIEAMAGLVHASQISGISALYAEKCFTSSGLPIFHSWSKMNLTPMGDTSGGKLDRAVHRWTAEYAAGHPGNYAEFVIKLAGSASQAGRLAINVPLIRDDGTWSRAGGNRGNVAMPPARDRSV